MTMPRLPYGKDMCKVHTESLRMGCAYAACVWTTISASNDRFVTVSHHDIIAGVPAIKMINGIDLSKIYPASPLPEDGSIHVIAVAKISPWHGWASERHTDTYPAP